MSDPSPSRPASSSSHAHSTFSLSSTRRLISGMSKSERPTAEPASGTATPVSVGAADPSKEEVAVSLSVNYLPSKFSTTLLAPGTRRRRSGKFDSSLLPKRGGGVEAFKSGESRMPGEDDDDYDGVSGGWFGGKEGGHTKPRLRWNKFKWAIFIANIFLTVYSLVALVFCLLTWFNVWTHADVVRVANRSELIISTIAACLGVATSLFGWAGVVLNNRSFLAIYTFLLWVVFAFLVAPGYLTYKRRTFNLEGKVNSQWSRALGADGRLRIQNQLGCCGYFSPFVEATVSQTCYARSILPGCKRKYLDFERLVLKRWFTASFALVPLHIAIILVGLLCSNHVTYRFGKGMMPKAYRLSMNSMAVIMDNYANQLAEQYGSDVATEILARSRSNVAIDKVPETPYTSATNTHNKYGSLSNRAPEGVS